MGENSSEKKFSLFQGKASYLRNLLVLEYILNVSSLYKQPSTLKRRDQNCHTNAEAKCDTVDF